MLNPQSSSPTHSLLLVDDDENMREVLIRILNKIDSYQIDFACDGCEAFEKYKEFAASEQPYDLMIVDLRMPRMDGETLIREVRKTDEDIAFIILTGHGDLKTAYALLDQYEISDYLNKPLKHSDELLFSVRNALEKRQLRLHLEESHELLEEKIQQIQENLEMAAQFQRSVLPPIRDVPFLKINVKYDPLQKVSGDFYDMHVDGKNALNVFLGDALGHGVPAALITMMVHISLDTLRNKEQPVDQIMNQLNKMLFHRLQHSISTGTVVRITPEGQLNASHAGFPPLVILPADGSEIVKIKKGGPALGVIKMAYDMESYQLQEGDKFFIFTDGCFEWFDQENKIFGLKRLLNLLKEKRDADIKTILNSLDKALKELAQGQSGQDDLTMLGFQYTTVADPHS